MHKSRAISSRWAATLAMVLLALTGCSGPQEEGAESPQSLEQLAATARKNGWDWQASLLEDGDITVAEYDEGHRRNLQCLKAAGMTYTEPERSVTDGFRWVYDIHWASLDEESGSREMSQCSEMYVADLEVAMAWWGEWRTDPALQADIVKCVTAKGYSVKPGTKNYREVWLQGSEAGLTQEMVAMCLRAGAQRLYPKQGYAIGF